jgi:hypothetical protein
VGAAKPETQRAIRREEMVMQDLTWDAVETSKPNRMKTDRNVKRDYLILSNKKLLFTLQNIFLRFTLTNTTRVNMTCTFGMMLFQEPTDDRFLKSNDIKHGKQGQQQTTQINI